MRLQWRVTKFINSNPASFFNGVLMTINDAHELVSNLWSGSSGFIKDLNDFYLEQGNEIDLFKVTMRLRQF